MYMRGSDSSNKDTHVSVRLDEETVEYIDNFADEMGLDSRSESLRSIIKTHNGLLFGNFFGVVDDEKLASEWGDVGHLLTAAAESDRGVPPSMTDARIVDVLEPIPVLLSAAEVELDNE
jgi:hypothetical protein